jgi:hypothetical protein
LQARLRSDKHSADAEVQVTTKAGAIANAKKKTPASMFFTTPAVERARTDYHKLLAVVRLTPKVLATNDGFALLLEEARERTATA